MSEERLKAIEAKIDRIEQALLIDCDAVDAATTSLRQHLGAVGFKTADKIAKKELPKEIELEKKAEKPVEQPKAQAPTQGPPKLPFDAAKINWKPMTRPDGSTWELASDDYNGDVPDYAALRKFLQDANASARLNVEGKFYWTMDTAIGRQGSKKNWRRR